MKRGLLALGLTGALAAGGCSTHSSAEVQPEHVYIPVNCESTNPADHLRVIRHGANPVVVNIYNAVTEQERSLAIGPDGYAFDASGKPGTQWQKAPEAGSRIGALAITADQDAVIFVSGEPTLSPSGDQIFWMGNTQAVTFECLGTVLRPLGNYVLIAA